jgi:hypothetical protein
MTYDTTSTAPAFASVSANVTRGTSGLGYGFSDEERAASGL